MIAFMLKQWMRHKERFLLSVIGVVLISGVLIYLFSLTESTKGTINETLQKRWKSTYDLVVTPLDSTPKEGQLMSPNFLNGITGGINYDQYETIKAIDDIEVAAPLSILGYTQVGVMLKNAFDDISQTGFYRYTFKKTHHNGLFQTTLLDYNNYAVKGSKISLRGSGARARILSENDKVDFSLWVDQFVVGIDPEQEAKLVGIDKAVEFSATSRYFRPEDKIIKNRGTLNFTIPVLLNRNSFSAGEYTVSLEKLDIPYSTKEEQQSSLKKISEGNGKEYLNTLNGKQVQTFTITGNELQNIYYNRLKKPDPSIPEPHQILNFKSTMLDYQSINSPFPKRWSNSFEVANFELALEDFKEVLPTYGYRKPTVIEHEEKGDKFRDLPLIDLNVVGLYDPNKLQVSKDPLTKLPLQTYRPAEAKVVLGPNSEPLNPIKKLTGSGSPTALLPNPPNLLTTIKAAETIMGGNSISSIRIKVKGIEEIGNASQKKLESVKEEIEKSTGLQVTITRGSSPQPTVTKIINKGETEGWMEQSWIHIGAAITILRETSLGYSSVLLAVLLIGIMYVLATSYVSYLTNKRDYSIFLALGWRTGMLRKMIIIEAISYVILISLLAAVVEYIFSKNGAEFNVAKVLLVGLMSLVIYGLGILIPLIKVGRLRPYQGIRSGEISSKSRRILKTQSIASLIVNQVLQRPGRNILSILAIALPSTLLSFYLFVSIRLDGILYTSYLGEFVAVEVNESHYFIMGAALFVGVMTTAEMMWQNIVERQNELALFKSVGWKNRTVGISILLEGALIGFLAGLAGLIFSMSYIGLMYGIFPWDSMTILSLTICIPTFIGILGAAIPASKALRTSPYEILKESA